MWLSILPGKMDVNQVLENTFSPGEFTDTMSDADSVALLELTHFGQIRQHVKMQSSSSRKPLRSTS